MSASVPSYQVSEEQAGQTLAACLRQWLPGQSWSQVRKLIAGRRVSVNGELWLDDARRLKVGDTVEVRDRPAPQPRLVDQIVLRHVDEHLIVAEKPAGIPTVRHPAELDWAGPRRQLVPTLDDLVLHQIGASPYERPRRGPQPRLRIVHRLDKETSGLVVFARTVEAERGLGRQFKEHTVTRRYLAVVPGHIEPQTVRSFLVRDRGDGRRGSLPTRSASPPPRSASPPTQIASPPPRSASPPTRSVSEDNRDAGEGLLPLTPGPSPQRGEGRRADDVSPQRGEGRRDDDLSLPRGERPHRPPGKEAITHIEVAEELPGYTLVRCRLETGRTHQIRIHLAELGHPVCGDKVYGAAFGPAPPDPSGAPRLALHAEELGFIHPVTSEALHWHMPLPPDLRAFLERLRGQAGE